MQDSYRELFLSESQEYLSSVSRHLVKLEENPSDLESLNEIFRCMHTFKGISATMGFEKLTQLSHHMEDLLDELRSQRKKVTTEIIDTLFGCLDLLGTLTEDVRLNQESVADISPCVAGLKKFLSSSAQEEKDTLPQLETIQLSDRELKMFDKAKSEGFNILQLKVTLVEQCAMKEARVFLILTNLARLGTILTSIPSVEDIKEGKFGLSFMVILITREKDDVIREETSSISDVKDVIVSSADTLSVKQVPSAQPAQSYIKKIQSMRIPVQRLDKIMNLMGEMAIAKIRLMQLVQFYKIDPLQEMASLIDHLTSSLQDEIMQTRLLPIAYILDAFPRVVRDLAKRQDKEVDLEVTGSEIELDRVVLDEMGDLFVHLVRNAIDHGIEPAQERRTLHKNPRGKIFIKAARQKGQIHIEVGDDGRGVDFEAVRRVAVSKGLVSQEKAQTLDEKDIFDLISMPGFSTADKITDISGRGVGLNVVKAKVEALGGRFDFETKLDYGSRFILTLPLTLAIIKAMLVRVGRIGENIFAIPLMGIRETIKISEDEIKVIQSFEVIRLRDELIPIVRLDKEFGINYIKSDKKEGDDRVFVVIVEYGQKNLGLVVNQVIGEQDIVVKPLGTMVKRTKGIGGATILGDGRVALILDIMSLR